MFYVYILQSTKSGRYYIGHTAYPDFRLGEHNAGKVVATKNKGPWVRVLLEQHPSRSEACGREREIKSWKSRARIEELISSVG